MPVPTPVRTAGRAALAAAAATALLPVLAAPAAADAAESHLVTAAEFGTDLRVTLTAHRVGDLEAKVELVAYRTEAGAWTQVDRATVGETWFWYPLTGTGAVCAFSVADPAGTPEVTVSLLLSPSLGCSDPETVTVTG
jgi:hypothetical protein